MSGNFSGSKVNRLQRLKSVRRRGCLREIKMTGFQFSSRPRRGKQARDIRGEEEGSPPMVMGRTKV